jgi:Na+/H+-dicarboxylate symporter
VFCIVFGNRKTIVGIREQTGERRTLATAFVVVTIIIFGAVARWDFSPSQAIRTISKAYFTTDESSVEAATAALFVDGAEKLAAPCD